MNCSAPHGGGSSRANSRRSGWKSRARFTDKRRDKRRASAGTKEGPSTLAVIAAGGRPAMIFGVTLRKAGKAACMARPPRTGRWGLGNDFKHRG